MKVQKLFEDPGRITRYKAEIEVIKKRIEKDGDPYGERTNEIAEIEFRIKQENIKIAKEK